MALIANREACVSVLLLAGVGLTKFLKLHHTIAFFCKIISIEKCRTWESMPCMRTEESNPTG